MGAVGSAVIGIDLGTTNSVAAAMVGGELTMIRDDSGRALVPSVVAFLPSGETVVGHEARSRLLIDPLNTIFSAKRIIGRPFSAADTQETIAQLPYLVTPGANQEPVVKTRAGSITVVDVSAFVLRHVRRLAENQLRVPVRHCVVTVPANFSDGQREATRRAAAAAGMEVLRVLNEPTAAACAFGLEAEEQRIAVFDLGGGTFDVTMMVVHDGLYEVRATGGDPFLGGDDFSNAIASRLADGFLADHQVDLAVDAQARARLNQAAEMIKMTLSKHDFAVGTIPHVAFGDGGAELDLEYRVARPEFHKMIEPFIARTMELTKRVLGEAGMTPADVDEVALVGGSTLVPLVRHRVAELFGKRLRSSINPLEVVATGAALQAQAMFEMRYGTAAGHDPYANPSTGLLMDVTSHALGIVTLGGTVQYLIDKNTTIPAESTHRFVTAEDDQEQVNIRIYQGREGQPQPLGELRLSGLRPAPRGEVQVEVSFFVDADGILRVSAQDLDTGRQEKAVLSVLGVKDEVA